MLLEKIENICGGVETCSDDLMDDLIDYLYDGQPIDTDVSETTLLMEVMDKKCAADPGCLEELYEELYGMLDTSFSDRQNEDEDAGDEYDLDAEGAYFADNIENYEKAEFSPAGIDELEQEFDDSDDDDMIDDYYEDDEDDRISENDDIGYDEDDDGYDEEGNYLSDVVGDEYDWEDEDDEMEDYDDLDYEEDGDTYDEEEENYFSNNYTEDDEDESEFEDGDYDDQYEDYDYEDEDYDDVDEEDFLDDWDNEEFDEEEDEFDDYEDDENYDENDFDDDGYEEFYELAEKPKAEKIRQKMEKWGEEKMDKWEEDSDFSKLKRKDWRNVRKNMRQEYGNKIVNYHRKMARQDRKEVRRL